MTSETRHDTAAGRGEAWDCECRTRFRHACALCLTRHKPEHATV